jgi:hypothetical protein
VPDFAVPEVDFAVSGFGFAGDVAGMRHSLPFSDFG